MADTSVVMTIMNDWIEKGDTSSSHFDQFICYWIAFNCYYANKTEHDSDRKAIHRLKSSTDVIYLFEELSKRNESVLEKLREISPVRDDREGSGKSPCHIKDLSFSEVIDLLYQVRCNLFHGIKNLGTERDNKVVSACAPVLGVLVKEFRNKFPNL